MDIVTHGLASLAVARGFFPRSGKLVIASAVLAGIFANIDWLSYYLGPETYLAWHHAYVHSILTAVLLAALIGALLPAVAKRKSRASGGGTQEESKPRVRGVIVSSFAAPICTALLHVAADACQSSGVALFLPFSSRRFAADWLPRIDPWILTILVVTIAVPELLRLVSSEIGAKEKRPRGQMGAIVGLALILVYVGARAILHSNVLAMMNARTFHGETPRRVSAFPESLSVTTWEGIAETDSALNEIEVNLAASSTFDPDTSVRIFKPEASPALEAARNTGTAKRFLVTAQVPKASVEKTETGYVVVLRDLRYVTAGETQREVAARIELDLNYKVRSEELDWARDLPR